MKNNSSEYHSDPFITTIVLRINDLHKRSSSEEVALGALNSAPNAQRALFFKYANGMLLFPALVFLGIGIILEMLSQSSFPFTFIAVLPFTLTAVLNFLMRGLLKRFNECQKPIEEGREEQPVFATKALWQCILLGIPFGLLLCMVWR